MTMNSTIFRFGYPATLIAEYQHWLVLLRPDQPTLGSLVLASTDGATMFSALPPAAFAELGKAVSDIETALADRVRYEKINYLMLMMVDPHVHWHVIPRYQGQREAVGLSIADGGWPKLPQLGDSLSLTQAQIVELGGWLRERWPG